MRLQQRCTRVSFLLPFAVLLVLWAVLVPYLTSTAPVPHQAPSGRRVSSRSRMARCRAYRREPAARGVGTVLAFVAAIPLGIAMGSARGVDVPHAAVSVLLRARRHRVIPSRHFVGYALARLPRDLQRGVLHRHHNTLLGVSTIRSPCTLPPARRGPHRHADRSASPGALPTSSPASTGLGFAWRGLIAAEMIATNVGHRLHALGTRLLPYRSHRARHDRDRRAVAAARRPCWLRWAPHRALGHGAARTTAVAPLEPISAPGRAWPSIGCSCRSFR